MKNTCRGQKLFRYFTIVILLSWMTAGGMCFGSTVNNEMHSMLTSRQWESVGMYAAETLLNMISEAAAYIPLKQSLVVLTNAGYAEVAGSSTQKALDGLSKATEASRGGNTLVEVHSAFWSPLWFAIYDKDSGFCAYVEVDPSEVANIAGSAKMPPRLFRVTATERIDAEYLYEHASEYQVKFENKIFGGNEFRIVTIANAVAAGAPADAVRAFEFHDHYCPGVTSGILIVRYLKKYFPPGKTGYFVHSVQPWCKEDALIVLLNATPGKRGYAVSYPTKSDIARRVPEAQNASTIVYRHNDQSGKWEGVVLGFEWGKTPCPETGNVVVDRLCADLWYLERLAKPEEFVRVIRQFEMPDGTAPTDWARPGVDPLQMLGLIKSE